MLGRGRRGPRAWAPGWLGAPRAPALVITLARLAVWCASAALASPAHADAIGPVEPRRDCPRGARSTELGEGHGSFAVCVPNLAREDWTCVDGRPIELVGLSLAHRHVSPSWDGRRGPMPPELDAMGSDHVIAEGACSPAADAPIVEAPGPAEEGIGLAGPLADGVPMGCQRVRAWSFDEAFRCPRSDPPPDPPPPPPTAPGAPAPPRAAASAPPTSSGCGCSAAQHASSSPLLVLGPLACILVGRRRRRAAAFSPEVRRLSIVGR